MGSRDPRLNRYVSKSITLLLLNFKNATHAHTHISNHNGFCCCHMVGCGGECAAIIDTYS